MWVSREMDEKKNVKICFAASSGGHYEQLMMLKPLMEKYDSFVITEKTDYSAEAKGEKTYYLRDKDERCGYVSGLMFFNQMGLTTQVPMMYEVVSNKATNDYVVDGIADFFFVGFKFCFHGCDAFCHYLHVGHIKI